MKPSAQFLTDSTGKRIAVQLPINEYEKMVERLEELEEVRAFDRAAKRKTVFEPFSNAITEIRSKTGKSTNAGI